MNSLFIYEIDIQTIILKIIYKNYIIEGINNLFKFLNFKIEYYVIFLIYIFYKKQYLIY